MRGNSRFQGVCRVRETRTREFGYLAVEVSLDFRFNSLFCFQLGIQLHRSQFDSNSANRRRFSRIRFLSFTLGQHPRVILLSGKERRKEGRTEEGKEGGNIAIGLDVIYPGRIRESYVSVIRPCSGELIRVRPKETRSLARAVRVRSESYDVEARRGEICLHYIIPGTCRCGALARSQEPLRVSRPSSVAVHTRARRASIRRAARSSVLVAFTE